MSIKTWAAQRDAKPIDCPKVTTAHLIASQRVDPAPPTRTETRILPTRKPLQTTGPTPSSGSSLHNKQESWPSSLQKGHPKHSNLNKVKRQRNIHQVKEHDENPLNQTEDKEYTWKRIQNNDSTDDPKSWKQNGVTDKLETSVEKMQEMFTRPRRNTEESINIEQYNSWD